MGLLKNIFNLFKKDKEDEKQESDKESTPLLTDMNSPEVLADTLTDKTQATYNKAKSHLNLQLTESTLNQAKTLGITLVRSGAGKAQQVNLTPGGGSSGRERGAS